MNKILPRPCEIEFVYKFVYVVFVAMKNVCSNGAIAGSRHIVNAVLASFPKRKEPAFLFYGLT